MGRSERLPAWQRIARADAQGAGFDVAVTEQALMGAR